MLNLEMLPLLCLAILPVQEAVAVPPAGESPLAGHWQGSLIFRGDELAVRLHLHQSGDAKSVMTGTLDIPDLMMSWHPVPLTIEQGSPQIEFPFGIGTFPLHVQGKTIRSDKQIGEDTMALVLRRDPAPRLSLEDVIFRHDGIHLAGRLVTPAIKGPFPAIILVHGSGKVGRSSWSYASRADFLARLGYAVLFYDKRGVGDSSPIDHDPNLSDLEQDVLAALAFLKQRDDIDSRRLGLLGWSQGSWLSMKIAAQSNDISFVILGSAAAVTPGQQNMQQVEFGMRNDGVNETQIQDALAYLGLYFYVARTGEGWDLLQRAIQRGQGSTWLTYVDQPQHVENLAWWGANHDFQAQAFLSHIKVPVLALYGGADWITPPSANAGVLEALVRSGGNHNITVATFPRADHRIELPMGSDETGHWRWPRIAPAMLDTLANWLNDLDTGFDSRSRSDSDSPQE